VEAEGGAPVPYALVLLLPDTAETPLYGMLSDADGRFRFNRVPPGTYRLRLNRIGFDSAETPLFELGTAEVSRHTLTGAVRPVEIAGLLVRPGRTACHTAERLREHPELHTLWREAQKGVATRRVFESQFSYRYTFRQVRTTEVRRGRRTDVRHDTLVSLVHNDPESAPRAEGGRRRFATQRGRSAAVRIPSEQELLDSTFLRLHCIESDVHRRDGAWVLRFRPVRSQRGRVDLRGSIHVDPETFQVRGLVLEYVQNRRAFLRVEIDYADVSLPGGVLRLPVAGSFTVRPTQARSDVDRTHGTIEFLGYEVLGSTSRTP
jgi:hypothetical protein